MSDAVPKPPIFLGVSAKAAQEGSGWNLLGVTRSLFLPFFPQPLEGLHCIVGLPRSAFSSPGGCLITLLFTDTKNPANSARARLNATFEPLSGSPQSISDPSGSSVQTISSGNEHGYEMVPIPAPPLVVGQPTTVSVDVEWCENKYHVGEFSCRFSQPEPLSEPERRALASRPGAARRIVVEITCTHCGDTLRFYTLLDPNDHSRPQTDPPAMYVHDAPSEWSCKCTNFVANLEFAKLGMHDLFRRANELSSIKKKMTFKPLYEKAQLANIFLDFQHLIHSTPAEEEVQTFIEDHPVIWAFLSPVQILHKPAVLTKKRADFGIITPQKVLYLVEIEKPQTKLGTNTGGLSAEVQKGIDQIRDWRVVVEDHRIAFLNELGLKHEQVHDIRFLLIAGLTHTTSETTMIKVKRNPPAPNTQFLCFDDLASTLYTLSGQLEML